MTDDFKKVQDEAAKEFADIEFDRFCGSYENMAWIKERNAFLAGSRFGYAYAQTELSAERAKNAELENELSATVIARNANKELFMEAQERIAELVAALKKIAATDISENFPDFYWLLKWRNDTKCFADNVLARYEENGETK